MFAIDVFRARLRDVRCCLCCDILQVEHTALYTPLSTLCTLHSALYTLQPPLCLVQSPLLHSTLSTLQSILHNLHPTLDTLHFTPTLALVHTPPSRMV